MPNPFFINNRREQLVVLAAGHAIPMISGSREMAASGGLVSYGANSTALNRQFGIYVWKILKGAMKAAGVARGTTRTFRHVFCSFLANQGVSPYRGRG